MELAWRRQSLAAKLIDVLAAMSRVQVFFPGALHCSNRHRKGDKGSPRTIAGAGLMAEA